ncbi:solute carrier family 35 member F2-like isoform X2 [Dysidea avara]|uniref:solute carrier family 35 member F2-like isoform X2 n=1 Tax=Dysidea avara TaxID=196820 RepID=UPI00332A848C
MKILSWKFAIVLMSGQVLSPLVTGIGVFTTLLENHTGEDISSTLTAGVFFLMSAILSPYIACRPDFLKKLRRYWWKCTIVAIGDVCGTYLQTLGFKFTSVASNQAITNGSMTVFVAALSILLIKKKYKLIHYISIIISTAGMVIVILEDLKTDTNKGNNPLVGDLICVAGGFGVAVANAGEEVVIKGELSVLDFTALIGFSGAIMSGIQMCILDRRSVIVMKWDLRSVLYFLGYQICNTSYYFVLPLIILQSSSMVASLSLLTSIAYSFLFSIFLFNNKFSAFYIGGFVVIMFGLILYNIISVPEGGTDQSVFSIGYWYNYGYSLFCEWRCRSAAADKHLVNLIDSDDSDDGYSTFDNGNKSVIGINS